MGSTALEEVLCKTKTESDLYLKKITLKANSYQQYTRHYIRHCEGHQELTQRDFPGGAVVGNPPANAGDTGLSPGPGRPHMPQGN